MSSYLGRDILYEQNGVASVSGNNKIYALHQQHRRQQTEPAIQINEINVELVTIVSEAKHEEKR